MNPEHMKLVHIIDSDPVTDGFVAILVLVIASKPNHQIILDNAAEIEGSGLFQGNPVIGSEVLVDLPTGYDTFVPNMMYWSFH